MDLLHGGRLRVQPAPARAAALLPDRGDVRPVRRLRLQRAARAGADGDADGPSPLPPARADRPRRRLRRRRAARLRALLPVLLALRPRGHLLRGDLARAARGHVPLPRAPATPPARPDRRAARARVRHQGDDLHHRLRGGHVLRRRAAVPARAAAAPAPRRPPRGVGLGPGRLPRRLHPALHDLPHAPRRRARALHRPRLLARSARGRPRRRGLVLLPRRPVRRRVAGAAARGRGSRVRAPAADAAARVPDLGLRGLAGRLLVGGREVRLAGAAPAAAAAAARRPRRAGDLGRPAALVRLGRDRGRGLWLRVRRLRLVHRQRAQPRRPARAAGLHPVLGGGQARRRPGRRARGAAADLDHRRLLGGRDLPVGLVLPRPRRQLRGARHERHPARLRRPHPHPGRARPPATRPATTRARSRSASGGCATTAR